jgi:hypothetical protein
MDIFFLKTANFLILAKVMGWSESGLKREQFTASAPKVNRAPFFSGEVSAITLAAVDFPVPYGPYSRRFLFRLPDAYFSSLALTISF